MRIASLQLFAFRNHVQRALDVPADAAVVGLIGPNGSGKTNILDALSLLAPGRGLRSDEARAHIPTSKRGWGFHTVLADGTTLGQEFTLGPNHGSRKVVCDGATIPVEQLGRLGSVVWMTPQTDFLLTGPATTRRLWLDDAATALLPAHAEQVARFDRHRRARLKILAEHSHADWLDAEEHHVADWGVRVLRGRLAYLDTLAPHMPGLTLALRGSALEILDTADPVATLRGKLQRSRDIDARLGRTHAGPNTLDVDGLLTLTQDARVPLGRLSSGQHKRALLSWLRGHVTMLTAQRKAPPLVLIDEFTAHLDAANRSALLDDLVALGCQIWLADTELPPRDGLWTYMVEPLAPPLMRTA